jgi:hypothetical protein
MASWAPEQIPFVTVIDFNSKFKPEVSAAARIEQVISLYPDKLCCDIYD